MGMNDHPRSARPAYLITIDTEGDNLWSKPRAVTTNNAEYLPRFQQLCERFGLKPTYLVDWDMVHSARLVEFAADVLARGVGEVGMHLHAWNTPPLVPLTADDLRYHPYLIEYPEAQMREKVHAVTAELEATFRVKMQSHRAGRWAMNAQYAGLLVEHGYRVDCSVTPHVSWRSTLGTPHGAGGPDYSAFADTAYLVDLEDIARPGNPGTSGLLEVPMSIVKKRATVGVTVPQWATRIKRGSWLRRALSPTFLWLRPNGHNLNDLLAVLTTCVHTRRAYAEFMLHSSELMPGGSPTFPTKGSIDRLYADLEALFTQASQSCDSQTLSEFSQSYIAQTTTFPAGSVVPST